MEKEIICSVVGFLGLLSAAMGFAAEAERKKGSHHILISGGTCVFPSTPAMGLGLGAAGAIMIAQYIVTKRAPHVDSAEYSQALGICLAFSWHAFLLACWLLFDAAVNGHKTKITHDGPTEIVSCVYSKAGYFVGGAILSLASMVLNIVCCLGWESANPSGWSTSAAPNQGGIAIGPPQLPTTQYPPGAPPQFPPPTAPPVYT